MNLASMRDLNTTDPLQPLGQKIEPPAPPPPTAKPLPSNPDVIVQPDGKFETQIERNKQARLEPAVGPDGEVWHSWNPSTSLSNDPPENVRKVRFRCGEVRNVPGHWAIGTWGPHEPSGGAYEVVAWA